MGIFDNVVSKVKEEQKERKKLKALEKPAYVGEKKRVDAAKKKKAAEDAIKRGQAKARKTSKNKTTDIKKSVSTWADRKAKEMKEQQSKEGPYKMPPGYKW